MNELPAFSLRSLRRKRWIAWVQLLAFLGWTFISPSLNAIYVLPEGTYNLSDATTWQPVWDGGTDNDPEPPGGPDQADIDGVQGDGLPNWFEDWYEFMHAPPEWQMGTMRGNPDSDYDGATDGDELLVMGSDPLDAYSLGMQLPDGTAVMDGQYFQWANQDSDGDGLMDWAEMTSHGTDPQSADSDGDGWSDGDELAASGGEAPYSPLNADTDGDGVTDLDDYFISTDSTGDYDGDGLTNYTEATTPHSMQSGSQGFTSVRRADTDGDGLSDGYEGLTQRNGEYKDASNPLLVQTDYGMDDGQNGNYLFPSDQAQPLSITTSGELPAAYVGSDYEASFQAANASGNVSWSVTPGSLPEGFYFSGSTLVGNSPSAGVFHFTIMAQDDTSTASAEFTLVITMPGVSITSSSQLSFYAGHDISYPFAASGGGGGYSWSGSPPSGLSLSAEGQLSGSIGSTGDYSFDAMVMAADGSTAQQTVYFSITEEPPPPMVEVTSSSQLTDAWPSQYYSWSFSASGGTGSYFWTASSLPAGLSLDSSGYLSGTPEQSGTFEITVTAADGNGVSGTQTAMLLVHSIDPPGIQITHPGALSHSAWTPFALTLQTSAPPDTALWWSLSNAPTGITINSASGTISGWSGEAGGEITFDVAVSDGYSSDTVTLGITCVDQDADGDGVMASKEHELALAWNLPLHDGAPHSSQGNAAEGAHDWLYYYYSELVYNDLWSDTDEDGLGSQLEQFLGTNPDLKDSDGDFRPDWWQRYQAFNRFHLIRDGYGEVIDQDGDGLPYTLELLIGTNDERLDSDSDGLTDAFEWTWIDYSSPFTQDTDGDGLDDGSEAAHFTMARFPDSDGDMLTDGEEVHGAFGGIVLDPLLQDTDADGILDYAEVDLTDTDGAGIPDRLEEYWNLDPSNPEDEYDDADGDGVTNLTAYQSGIDIRANFEPLFDPDGDRITTVFELATGLDPNDRQDGADDPDGDFLTSTEEYKALFWPSAVHTLPYELLTSGLPLRHIPDRDDATGTLLRDAAGQPVMRPAANDYEWQRRQELFMHPVCRDGIQRDLTRDNGPLDPARQFDDDWDQDGASNLDELFPPGGGRPSDPRVWDSPPDFGPSLPDAQVGQNYWHRIMVSGGQGPFTFQIVSGDLPSGLSLDASGIISGDDPLDSGNYSLALSVTDGLNRTNTRLVTLTVAPLITPVFGFLTSENLDVHRKGGVFSIRLDVVNVPSGPVVFSASGLPSPVTLTEDGQLTVDGSQEGGYSFGITATDSSTPPNTTSRGFNIGFVPHVTLSYPPPVLRELYLGDAVSIVPTATGMEPLTFTAAGLPPGLQIHPITGAITGTPTTTGSYTVSVTLTDRLQNAPQTAHATMTLRVHEGPITITTTGIPAATKGQAYSGQVTASGGNGALHFSASGLPAGLLLDGSTGAITGTPTGFGPHAVTLTITDSHPDFPITATANVSLPVSSTTDLQLQINLQPTGKTGQFYAGGITGAHGLPPYTYSLIQGSLPSGLAFNASTGIVSGTPTTTGSRALRFRVTDSNNPPLTAEAAATIYIYDHFPLALATTQQQLQGVPNEPYSVTLSASGGSMLNASGYAFEVSGLDGNPAGIVFDPFTATLSATDPPPSTDPLSVSITVTRGEESITEPRTITFAPPLHMIAGGTQLDYSEGSGLLTKQVMALGGSGPLTFQPGMGSFLPPNMSLTSSGMLSGYPSQGSYSFVIEVSDSFGRTVSTTFTLTVSPLVVTTTTTSGSGSQAGSGGTITQPDPPDPLNVSGGNGGGTVGVPISSVSVDGIGGVLPYTFNASGLPSGLSIDPDTGLITGTPSQEGNYSITVSFTDATGAMSSRSATITVGQAASSTQGGNQNPTGGTQDPPDPNNGQTGQTNQPAQITPPRLLHVSFKANLQDADASPMILTSDDQTVTYSEPHWKVTGTNTSPDRSNPNERNYPVAYASAKSPLVEFSVDLGNTTYQGKAMIRLAQGSSATIQGAQDGVPVPSGGVGICKLTALPNTAAFYDADATGAFTLNWEVKLGTNANWQALAPSKHTVYVVKSKPIKNAVNLRQE